MVDFLGDGQVGVQRGEREGLVAQVLAVLQVGDVEGRGEGEEGLGEVAAAPAFFEHELICGGGC